MFRSRIFWKVGLAVALALTFGARSASAVVLDQFFSTLTVPNDKISGYTGPYADVQVDLTSTTTATITFTSETHGGNIYLMGDGGAVAVELNATNFTVTNISGSNAGTGFSAATYTFPGNKSTEDGFGTFNVIIDASDGFKSSADTITFTVTNTSSTWATAADVLTFNAQGFDAAAHIFVTASPAVQSKGAKATGYAGEGTGTPSPTPVPEPSTMAIAGLGALGFVGYGLRRRLKK